MRPSRGQAVFGGIFAWGHSTLETTARYYGAASLHITFKAILKENPKEELFNCFSSASLFKSFVETKEKEIRRC